jgi:hypothetical protein
MKIGIIGPNKVYSTDVDNRKRLIDNVAEIIAKSGNEIVLTPDKSSLLDYFGKKYTEFGGKKIWLVIPTHEENHQDYLNTEIGEIIDCSDWDRQANEFNRQCDIFICIGFAWGALKEIACAQYFNKKKVYILKEFISNVLPEELNFLVEYTEIDKLEVYIN